MNTREAVLSTLPFLRGSSDRDLLRIARLCDEARIEPGTVLTAQGRPGRQGFIIIEGSADVTIDESHVATLGPGQFVGEMAMLDQGPRSATVRAHTAMQLLVIGPADFAAMVAEPAVTRAMAAELAQRLRRAADAGRPMSTTYPITAWSA